MANLLLVDDNAELLELTRRVLERDGHQCTVVTDVGAAVAAEDSGQFELVICDLLMPDASGLTFLSRVADRAPQTAAVVMTAVNDVGVADQAISLGVYGYIVKPADPPTLVITVRNALKRRESELQSARLNQEMTELVHRRTEALMGTIDGMRARMREAEQRHEEILHALSTAAEFRGVRKSAHPYRVGRIAAVIGKHAGLNREECALLRTAAALHDVGNVGLPRDLVSRRGPLTEQERRIGETHTGIGYRILSGYDTPTMDFAARIALTHHERWDGSGYPEGLRGSEIPLVGRITAIADVFDSMISDRPHREALPIDDAFSFLEQGAGTLFDPDLVAATLEDREEIERLAQKYSDRPARRSRSEAEFPSAS